MRMLLSTEPETFLQPRLIDYEKYKKFKRIKKRIKKQHKSKKHGNIRKRSILLHTPKYLHKKYGWKYKTIRKLKATAYRVKTYQE